MSQPHVFQKKWKCEPIKPARNNLKRCAFVCGYTMSNGAAHPPIMVCPSGRFCCILCTWSGLLILLVGHGLPCSSAAASAGFANSRHCRLALSFGIVVWGQRLYDDACLLRTCPRIVNGSSSVIFPSASANFVIGRQSRARLLPCLRCDLSCEPGIPFDSDCAHSLCVSPLPLCSLVPPQGSFFEILELFFLAPPLTSRWWLCPYPESLCHENPSHPETYHSSTLRVALQKSKRSMAPGRDEMDSLRPRHRGGLRPPLHARYGSHSTALSRTPSTRTAHVPGTVDDHLDHEGTKYTESERSLCESLHRIRPHSTPNQRARGLSHSATHCNTHCNTLQHTAALHYNTRQRAGHGL